MTCVTSGTSMPRAAMSVATRIGALPDLKSASARSRWDWPLLPWMALAARPSCSSEATILSAPCLVRLKISVRPTPSVLSSEVSTARLELPSRMIARWLTRSAVVATGRGLDADRVGQHVGGEARDVRRHGGREEHRHALLRHLRDDLADRRQEAGVEHLVGLVEHQDLGVVEARMLGAEVVDQAARGGHQHVHAAGERPLLRHVADAAEHGGDGEA
jgi:hypothetical protein